MKVEIILPFPPTINLYWRHIIVRGSVRNLLSAKGRRYRSRCIAECQLQGIANAGLHGPLSVWIDVYPPDRRKRDLDNMPKAILDSLTHAGVWGDDSQVDDLRLVRGTVIKKGFVSVKISAMGEPKCEAT